MSLADQIVDVSITRATLFPTQEGFGIPLLMAYHTRTANLIDSYTSLKGMTDAGFTVTEPAYRMATAAFSVNPRPPRVYIGRRTSGPTMIIKLTPLNTTVGFAYKFNYIAPDGVTTAISYTVQSGDDASDIAAALTTALDALGGSSAAAVADVITITASAAGAYFDLSGLPGLQHLKVENTTLDATIVTQYNAVKAVDGASWYGVTIDSCAPAEYLALKTQIETEHKILAGEVSDSECADVGVTDDIMSQLKAASIVRTFLLFAQERIRSYRSVAWMSKGLALGATKPGGTIWGFLTLEGITVDTQLTDGQALIINDLVGGGKRGNFYGVVAGLNEVQNGVLPDGEFVDMIVGTDWLFARLKEQSIAALHNSANTGGKIPFTQPGAAVVQNVVLGVLGQGVVNGFLAADPAPTCTVPKVSTLSKPQKASRQLNDVNFGATIAGAIQTLKISGVLSV